MTRLRHLAPLAPLALFAALGLVLWRGLDLDPQAVPSPLIGKPAPDFTLGRLDDAGASVRRDDLRGRPWVLNVRASWCEGCREEHRALLAFARSAGVPVVGLDYKDTRQTALEWLARMGDPYRATAFDPAGRVGLDYGVYGVPETFVVDAAGVIRAKFVGPLTPERIRTELTPLLKTPGATP
jgi:cytochrome c biogenesis protein CcmG/thiol:disulfide interchange protein DsbE